MMSNIGSEASKAAYTKNDRLAAQLWGMYHELYDQAEAHISNNLPGAAKESWEQYRNEHKALMQKTPLMEDLAGGPLNKPTKLTYHEAMDGVNRAFNTVEGGRQVEIKGKNGLLQDMKAYGVDIQPLQKAAESSRELMPLLRKEQNIFQGKIRNIINHPLLVGAPAAGAGVAAGRVAGVAGHLVAPLIVASKIGRFLDDVQLFKILRDIRKAYPDEPQPFAAGAHGPANIALAPAAPAPTPGGPAPGQPPAGGAPPGGTPGPQPGAGQPPGAPPAPANPLAGQPIAQRRAQLAAEAAQPVPGGGRYATPAEVDDLEEARGAEEERQFKAKKLSEMKRKGKGK
jgi:hypothetical protein